MLNFKTKSISSIFKLGMVFFGIILFGIIVITSFETIINLFDFSLGQEISLSLFYAIGLGFIVYNIFTFSDN